MALSRKQFLKYCAALAASLGLKSALSTDIAKAIEDALAKPPVIWLEGQDCGGCFASTMNSASPNFADILLDMLSVRFQPELINQSSQKDISDYYQDVGDDKYILIVSGSIPTGENGNFWIIGYDKNGNKITLIDAINKISKNASAIIALGTCASFGGVPASFGQFRITGLGELIKNKQVVNVSGCPPHPDWVIGTIVNALLFDKAPELDKFNRPIPFFGKKVHDDCPRRGKFENAEFAENLGESGKCLYKIGCKGPVTYADCPRRKFNDRMNWCVDANSPCLGCTEPRFYEGFEPLLSPVSDVKLPFLGGVNPTTIGISTIGATGIGIASHAAYKHFKDRFSGKSEEFTEEDDGKDKTEEKEK